MYIDNIVLSSLVQAGSVRKVKLVPQGGGWGLEVHHGGGVHYLHTRRKQVRRFVQADAALRFVKGVGLGSVEVDVSKWEPTQKQLDNV